MLEYILLTIIFLLLFFNILYEMFLAPSALKDLPQPDKRDEDFSKEE